MSEHGDTTVEEPTDRSTHEVDGDGIRGTIPVDCGMCLYTSG
ncbi:MAG TPA: hypothetical protein VHJ83_14300 [Micromonosporaceae bacterium]|nr:hypothetical protein [Micromonosporaceae bacterium]